MEIGIIDYGAGNLRSISNALRKVGGDVKTVSTARGIEASDALVLPGVGNFGDAMGRLEPVRGAVLDKIRIGTPFLGLCLGLQVLLEGSKEAPAVRGLDLLKGHCERFPEPSGKIPHMGWNSLKIEKKTPLLGGIEDSDYFYFVHSYYGDVQDKDAIAASCEYGVIFPAVLSKNNIYACQFHPERSGEKGLRILENFVSLAGN
ncbi:MAG: imidazole glycerol phosphate synthase subunit HisH [Candidatus Altiarchaeota archaeon]|nr:imidazole glycerol phosphate synthase subunit HisH [Candidatus Altiarchaeota archaeon]